MGHHRCVVLMGVLGACASSASTPTKPLTSTQQVAHQPATSVNNTVHYDGDIKRERLQIVLDAGLGRFLQGVHVEPRLKAGTFVGFEIVSLYPHEPAFKQLDLQPGDIVLSVNSAPIERPEQALNVWDELRVASELRVRYIRGAAERELRFRIVD